MHSGALKIIEPVEYNGLYRLELPKGMSALCDNITYVYGNEEYELVSDHQPTIEDTFTIKAEFVWMKDFKQYAPMGDVEVHGKKVSKYGWSGYSQYDSISRSSCRC